MNVVDSSGWLEYVANGPNADFFAAIVESPGTLVVPSVSIYEVFKKLAHERGEHAGLQVVALMHQGTVVDLDAGLALDSARVSAAHKLPMADAIMLATARAHGAMLWTQDADFDGLAGVRYRARAG